MRYARGHSAQLGHLLALAEHRLGAFEPVQDGEEHRLGRRWAALEEAVEVVFVDCQQCAFAARVHAGGAGSVLHQGHLADDLPGLAPGQEDLAAIGGLVDLQAPLSDHVSPVADASLGEELLTGAQVHLFGVAAEAF